MTEVAPTSDDTQGFDSGADSKERFAADLRKLKLDAGNPTLAKMQGDTGISRSVLSDAFAGRQLPTGRTVDGIVRACGEDPAPWLDRRDVLAGLVSPPAASIPGPASAGAAAGQTAVAGIRRRTAVMIAAAAFLLGSAMSGAAASLVTAQVVTADLTAAETTVTPQIIVQNGEDPAFTECVEDAKVATADSRIDDTLIEIIWSNECYAGWARITRYDAKYEGNTVTIAIYPETAPDGPDRQEATEHGVQGAYTTLVVRPSPNTLLCAEGSFTVDGESFDLGDPICI